MEPPVLVAITFYTVVLALLLFIGFLAYKLGKVTITGLFALGTKAGGSPLVSLICFAIAVAMFREPLKYVVGAVSNSSLFVVDEYLRQLNDITFEANNEVASQLVSQTIRMTTYLLYGLITNLQLERFPIAQTIFLLSAWLVLAAAVQIISDRVRAERAGADDTVKKVQSPTLKNVGLFALLGIGIYFSLIATAAIPSLSERKLPEAFSPDKFKDQLDGLKMKEDALDKLFPDEGTSSGTDADQSIRAYWSAARMTYKLEEDSLAELYRVAYQTEYDRKGQRQTLEYYKELIFGYRGRLVSLQKQLTRCWLATHSKESEKEASRPKARDFSAPVSNLDDRSMPEGPQKGCTFSRDEEMAHTRAGLSAGYGPLGVMMNWLLANESLPLTLIVGLMGFGLLGATCSTFVRQAPVDKKGSAYVEDLTSVFIRGVSAAIVVFLAVYGGLAVFAAGEADPNPYAVLFAVLVAAVFSDDAWNWARSKFAAQMANRDQSGDQTRKPEGEPDAAKTEVQAAQTPQPKAELAHS